MTPFGRKSGVCGGARVAGTLAKRVITAAVLIPAVLALVFYGRNTHVALGFGLVVVGCAWEWSGLNAWRGVLRWVYTLSLMAKPPAF